MNVAFLGLAGLLAAAAGYWILGRGRPRPTGTWAIGALLGFLALAFATSAPLFTTAVEGAAPPTAQPLSTCAGLAAATAGLTLSFQLNLEPAQARCRVHLYLLLITASALAMAVLFTCEHTFRHSPRAASLCLLPLDAYFSFAVIDFTRHTLRHAKTTRRTSLRLGLHTAAAGCPFTLGYTTYKITIISSAALGPGTGPNDPACTSFITAPCIFHVTFPALAVLLICIGLTLPALTYPIEQTRQRRWELRSFDALGPLWTDLSAAMPAIVLSATGSSHGTTADPDFLLQRRVIEISDGLLALRPYRSQQVKEAASRRAPAAHKKGAAYVESAIIKAALAAKQEARLPQIAAPPMTTDAPARNSFRDDTEWLTLVARAYAERRHT